MRYREIVDEAPLGDFDVYGDTQNAGSFNSSEVKAMHNQTWLKKLTSHLSRTPYKINVYFYNAPGGEFADDYGNSIKSAYDGRIKPEEIYYVEKILNVKIPQDKDAITFIMMDNEGDEKVGLTPWIVAHRLVHSLIIGRNTDEWKVLTDFVRIMLFSSLAPKDFLKFKSAKTESVIREGEYSVELMTQYIVQGSITVNTPELDYPVRDGYFYPWHGEPVKIKKDSLLELALKTYEPTLDALPGSGRDRMVTKMVETEWLKKFPTKKRTFDFNFPQMLYTISNTFVEYTKKRNTIRLVLKALPEVNEAAKEIMDTSVGKVFVVSGR